MKINSKLIYIIPLFGIIFNSCGKNDNPRNDPAKNQIPEKQKVSITLQDGVKIIKDDVVSYLIDADKSTGIYLFSADADELENLSEGEITIFEGHSIRQVKKVELTNNEYKVYTEYATLNQVIRDGEIYWEKNFNWGISSNVASATVFADDYVFKRVNDAGTVTFEGKIKGWDVSIDLQPEAENKLNIEITASKMRGDQKVAALFAKGWISNFENTASMNFSGGNLTSFEMNNRNLKGELEVKFAIQGMGSDVALIDLPAEIGLPIRVGWVPVEIILKANLKMYPEVRQGASSIGSYKLTYDSNMGFTFGNNQTNATGSLNSHNMEVTDETVSAGAVTTGFGVGVEFPRFEISILNELVVPYFLLNVHASTFYEPGILSNLPPCQQGMMNFKSIVGVSMKLFALSYEYQTVLWEKERKWQTEGSNCGD